MSAISKEAIEKVFTQARTHHAWSERPVEEGLLQQLYHLLKWGPTSVNGSPGRFLFLRQGVGREPLLAALMGKNAEQTRSAPVTVIIAYDQQWLAKLAKLSPAVDYLPHFAGKTELTETTAFRNSSMQGAYFIMAARALGLDCGPMSGFDHAAVDDAYFRGTSWRSNFLCNLGYGDAQKLYPRAPRLDFAEACRIL